MTLRHVFLSIVLSAVLVAGVRALESAVQSPQASLRTPDVIFVPTPQDVVDAMLTLANVTGRDVVYDLGSGDGRIPITAAKTHGARGIGIDIDPQRINEAKANAIAAAVTDKVTFLNQDLFATDIHEATVVTMYLLPSLNLKVLPKLNAELKPGTRVVSHQFDMAGYPPERTVSVSGRNIYLWTIPIKPAQARNSKILEVK
jgi:SAM-dependent methyltransferase